MAHYVVMLVGMYFNYYVLAALVIGNFIGHMLFDGDLPPGHKDDKEWWSYIADGVRGLNFPR